MARKRRGKTVRRNRSKMKSSSDEIHKKEPHTMIFSRGQVGIFVRQLANDMRSMFEPYTATNLRAKRKNSLKDFIAVSGQLKVSHLMYFTRPEPDHDGSSNIYLRLLKTPNGPTLTFRVLEYALKKNVQSSIKKAAQPTIFHHPPLQVLQGFSGEGLHLKLMVSMIQNLLPPLNVRTLKLKTVRRVLLWSRAAADSKEDEMMETNDATSAMNQGDVIHLRHYSLRVRTRGLSRPLKRLQRKQIPNLGSYTDVHEWVTRGAAMSDSGLSEESGSENEVEILPSAGLEDRVVPGSKASVHAQEIGPRLTLQLIKVEAGVVDGEVLYHRFQNKSSEEVQELQQRARRKRKTKQARKERQAKAVEEKKKKKEEHKKKCLAGMGINVEADADAEEEDSEDE